MKKARAKSTPPRWIYLIPVVAILWIWLSSLSFVPVPWPDDSAFYFPAKDLFSWPPRWVMIPQAPFEPSYREWNFNTMPLYPILIGLVRAFSFGAIGTHALKLLPLGAWLGGILFALRSFRRAGASTLFLVSAALVLSLDPVLRWSSVLIRPESLIAAMGIVILFGTRFGWPDWMHERKFFHPVSLALLISAYSHFNAIHLLPLVIVLYATDFRKLVKIGALTGLGLVPWLVTIALKPALFSEQMALQFSRLAGYHNPWLSSFGEFAHAILEDMGTPENWAPEYQIAVLACVVVFPVLFIVTAFLLRKKPLATPPQLAIFAAAAWFFSGAYLWHTKAEVWFTHYFHLAFWAWLLLVLFEFREKLAARIAIAFPLAVGLAFLYGQIAQTARLEASETWHWDAYGEWIDCIDSFLTSEDAKRGYPQPFRVWDPTYPDITIELSRRHPDWEFTRTNDFMDRSDLAVKHGYAVEAMVVTEIFRTNDRHFKGSMAERPENGSVWMNWESYFLNRLQKDPAFKSKRFLCQNGRWDAFIYLNP
jgi:hypothetical protein